MAELGQPPLAVRGEGGGVVVAVEVGARGQGVPVTGGEGPLYQGKYFAKKY